MPTAPEFTIRAAHVDDSPAMAAILASSDALHRDALPWLFRDPGGPSRSRDDFAALIDGDAAALLVADSADDGVVGVVHGLLRPAPDFPVFVKQSWGVLDGLVVAPTWRRRGVGRALALAFEQWATARGAAWIELNVYAFNVEAERFYAALGYASLLTRLRKASPDGSSTA